MSKPGNISEAVGRRGLMLVLSSPSGAGKTSIARRLLDEDDNLTLSVSATTRPPRANEVDGRSVYDSNVDGATGTGFNRKKFWIEFWLEKRLEISFSF